MSVLPLFINTDTRVTHNLILFCWVRVGIWDLCHMRANKLNGCKVPCPEEQVRNIFLSGDLFAKTDSVFPTESTSSLLTWMGIKCNWASLF